MWSTTLNPNNRLVADTLEALWNDKLRLLEQAREDYEKQRESAQRTLTHQKAQILALAEGFPRLWKDPGTTDRDRKRMARLILEDVTLTRDQTLITAQVRLKGGATKVLRLPMPARAWQLRKTKAEIVAEIDHLLEQCTESEIADELNSKDWRSSGNQSFNARRIHSLRTSHKLPSRSERLRAKGLLTARQIAELIGSKPLRVDYWRAVGLLNGIRLNDKNEYLYEDPSPDAIQQIKRRMAGFASAAPSTPVVEMAGFDNRKYRLTVSRSIPSSSAMRRCDHPRSRRLYIVVCRLTLRTFDILH